MDAEGSQLGRGFWVRWVAASAIGLFVGFYICFMSVVGLTGKQSFILKILVSAVSGAALGIAVGGAQWSILRHEVSGTNRWVVTNLTGGIIGGVIALPIAEAVGEAMGFNMAVFAGSIVLGLSIGIAQVIILRGHLLGSGWWVLAHAAGMPLGWALGRSLGESVYNLVVGSVGESTAQVIATTVTVILFFGCYGVIAGGIIVGLINRNQERN